MAVTITPSSSAQFVSQSENSNNLSTVGLIASSSGTGRRWRMRYTFSVSVQMSSFTVTFKLSKKLSGKVSVGFTSSLSTICPRDVYVTMSSTSVKATFNKTLTPGKSYYLWLDYTGSTFETATCTRTNVSIAAIPAASTLTAASGTLGVEQTLTINAGSSAFTHTVQYAVGSASGTIATNTSETALTWTPPLSLAEQNTKGKSVSCTFTVITYVNGTENARSTKTVSYTIPASAAPEISLTLTPENGSLPSAFSGVYVQGRSKVNAAYSVETKYGAAVSGYATTVGTAAKSHASTPYVSDILASAGSIDVTGKVTDSRGYTASVSENITVESYDRPTLTPVSGAGSIVCGRATSDGVLSETGLQLRVRVGKKFSSVAGINRCLLRYRIAEDGADYGEWKTLLEKGSTANDISTNPGETLESTKAYVVEIGVVDDIGESMSVEFRIPTLDVPLHLGKGGKNIGIGRYADYSEDHRVDVGWDVNLASGVRIHPYPGEEEAVLEALGYNAPEIPEASDEFRPNLLDNWYFGDPVNQRGKTSYAATGYTIDRWAASSGSVTVAIGADSITVSASSGSWQNINQAIASPSRLNGQTLTLSAFVETDHHIVLSLKNVTTNVRYEATIKNPSGVVSLTYEVADNFAQDSDTVRFYVYITTSTSEASSVVLKAVKLELGDTQTLAHRDADGNWPESTQTPVH